MFARIAFKEDHAPMELEYSVADEYKCFPLALDAVSAAMKGKRCVDEWEISLPLVKPSDPSFPHTHAPVDQDLYQRLKWSYGSLPLSNVEICFFSSAMLMGDADSMWTN